QSLFPPKQRKLLRRETEASERFTWHKRLSGATTGYLRVSRCRTGALYRSRRVPLHTFHPVGSSANPERDTGNSLPEVKGNLQGLALPTAKAEGFTPLHPIFGEG